MIKNHPKIAHFQHSASLKLALIDLGEYAACFGLHEKRVIEKQAALFVAQQVLHSKKIQISYLASGKPFIENGPKISISHAYDRLAVLFSTNGKEVGVDIEKVRDKILNIKHKFLSPAELARLADASLTEFTLYWAVKEAVYKASGIEGLAFAEQIVVEPFNFTPTGGSLIAYVRRDDRSLKFVLHYNLIDDYVLAYTDNL